MVFQMLKDILLHGDEVDLKEPARSADATIFLYEVLRLLGAYWPKERNPRYAVYAVLVNFVGLVYVPVALILSYVVLFDEMEAGDFITSLQAFMGELANVCKMSVLIYWVPRIKKLDTLLEKMDARCVDDDEKRVIHLYAKKGNRLFIFFCIVYNSYTTSTVLSGLYMHRPAFSMYNWPLDWKRSSLEFYCISAKEYILSTLACMQIVANDSYSVIYVGILLSHLQALMLRIDKIGRKSNSKPEDNTLELIKCIKDHKNIIELHNAIHSPISMTLLIHFGFTAIIVSITVVNITFFADFGAIVASLLYVSSVMSGSAVCCYYANCLMDESNVFADIIFHSNWVEQDAKFKKVLIYFLHRSQQTITFTAGKLFPINLSTFLSIAKFSFSLYTFLKEMNFDQKLKQD